MPRALRDQPLCHLQTQPAESTRNEIATIGVDGQRMLFGLLIAHEPRDVSSATTQRDLVLGIRKPQFLKETLRARLNCHFEERSLRREISQINARALQLGMLPHNRAPEPPQRRLCELQLVGQVANLSYRHRALRDEPQARLRARLDDGLRQLQYLGVQVARGVWHILLRDCAIRIQTPQVHHAAQIKSRKLEIGD